jgi:hypothetical protein
LSWQEKGFNIPSFKQHLNSPQDIASDLQKALSLSIRKLLENKTITISAHSPIPNIIGITSK